MAPLHFAHRLWGHCGAVTCVALSVELALAATASEDGSCILHDTQSGLQMRAVGHPDGCAVHALALAGEGELLLFSAVDSTLRVYSACNGEHLASMRLHRLRALCATQRGGPGFFVVVEDHHNQRASMVSVRRSHDLSLCAALPVSAGIACCAAVHEPLEGVLEVAIGLESGQLLAWSLDLREVLVDAAAARTAGVTGDANGCP